MPSLAHTGRRSLFMRTNPCFCPTIYFDPYCNWNRNILLQKNSTISSYRDTESTPPSLRFFDNKRKSREEINRDTQSNVCRIVSTFKKNSPVCAQWANARVQFFLLVRLASDSHYVWRFSGTHTPNGILSSIRWNEIEFESFKLCFKCWPISIAGNCVLKGAAHLAFLIFFHSSLSGTVSHTRSRFEKFFSRFLLAWKSHTLIIFTLNWSLSVPVHLKEIRECSIPFEIHSLFESRSSLQREEKIFFLIVVERTFLESYRIVTTERMFKLDECVCSTINIHFKRQDVKKS